TSLRLEGVRIGALGPVEPQPPTETEEEPKKKRRKRDNGTPPADPWSFAFVVEVPSQPAQAVFDGIPYGLRPNLDGIGMEGELGFRLALSGSSETAIENWDLETGVTLSEDFAVTRWPDGANVMGLNTGMTMTVMDPNAMVEHTIEIPPSTHAIGSVEEG